MSARTLEWALEMISVPEVEYCQISSNIRATSLKINTWVRDIVADALPQEVGFYSPEFADLRKAVAKVVTFNIECKTQIHKVYHLTTSDYLTALLYYDISTRFLHNPYFFLQDAGGDGTPELSASFRALYEDRVKDDSISASTWRSELYRDLDPDITIPLLNSLATKHAHEFMNGPARKLMCSGKIGKNGDELERRLEAIYDQMLAVAYNLQGL
ncbi:hypothetical protein PVAG01_00331 [Phlyctema vagabunda]|uniref:Uncharacterized protein n=1 Tax=Phlyctema vagabunda TaxID=108571 RepID=A0ABR4PTY2_9HELO